MASSSGLFEQAFPTALPSDLRKCAGSTEGDGPHRSPDFLLEGSSADVYRQIEVARRRLNKGQDVRDVILTALVVANEASLRMTSL
jgi:hypothetical protein